MTTIEQVSVQLEDTFNLIKKAHINFKKCPKAKLTSGYIRTRITSVDEYWATFKQLHHTLLSITSREQRMELPYFVQEYYDKCEDEFLTLRTNLEDMIIRPGEHTTLNTSTIATNGSGTAISLPKIQLPKYSGSYEEWQTFEDTFLSLIHNNKILSDVQRLHYLKSCLIGEAGAAIKHFQVTEANYQPAWDALKSRYSHKRLVVNAILKRLFSHKKLLTQTPNLLKNFVDTTRECLIGLNNLDISTDSWDPLIIFLSMQKLDSETHKQWEDHVSKDYVGELPKLNDLLEFVEKKIQTLELTSQPIFKPTREKVFHVAMPERSCICCNENHALSHCKKFSKQSPEERSEYVKKERLCFNCLLPGHPVHFCKQKISCRICGRRHHSLLHQRRKESSGQEKSQSTEISLHTNVEENQGGSQDANEDIAISSHFVSKKSTALLATALVPVRNELGQITILRALVDQGSQATFISERATQLLKVKRSPIKGTITGVGSTKTTVNHVVQIEVLSRCDANFNLKVKAYVMSTRLTTQLPSKTLLSCNWPHTQGLFLADPSFNQSQRIDLLLGVEVCAQILKSEVIRGPPGTPCIQNTSLGWIIFGNIEEDNALEEFTVLHHHLDVNDEILRNMWELELTNKRTHTAEEKLCEEIYKNTTSRTESGRYMVKLPLRNEPPVSIEGNTREVALKRFLQLERKFERQPKIRGDYIKVIEEYIEMKHMERVPKEEKDKPAVYLPHHAVIREDKETTKLRVVFDASAKGSNKVSLNEELLIGPQLQEDLRNLIMRWRMRRVCYVADIQKMYRQILVHKEDADYQRIIWRKSNSEDIQDYRLLRVTFGTASAPYLAVRTIQQVAEDEGKDYPLAAQTIKEDFFVDDLMSGEDTVMGAVTTTLNITNILEKGGFSLQKWCSNSAEFLQHIKPSQRSANAHIDIKVDGTTRALGLSWNMGEDVFQYKLQIPPIPEVLTKRIMLGEIQKLFDPLGWISPAILPAKCLMQNLWVKGIGWDEEVTPVIRKNWIEIRNEFEVLGTVKLNRWLNTTKTNSDNITIHGFCDASTKGYAAVAYIRVRTEEGEIKTGIIAAKTRVAPVKPVSLPRLELCGAVLLSRLVKQVSEAMRIPLSKIFLWTDSEVVLSWLFGDPRRWNVFVSNRVVEILDNVGNDKWYHVLSKHNPADVASRGLTLAQLVQSEIWWYGPEWLRTEKIPFNRPKGGTDLEKRKGIAANLNIMKDDLTDINKNTIKFENFNSINELQRVIVYARRFLNSKRRPEINIELITTEELERALEICIKITQKEDFSDEINNLTKKREIKNKSNLKSLNPMIDKEGILRVGGRLRHCNISDDAKHPIILGHENPLVALLIADAHKKTLHGGLQLMMSYLRSRYWIIRIKPLIRRYIHRCLICARQRANNREQLMGDLPKVRVTPARPFLNSGVDYAGPLQILMSRSRGARCFKAYISIFICMATKAIHLELVGDLTSESFLGAFKRFVARRGKCRNIWSDQGTNFIAANKELHDLWQKAQLEIPGHLIDILAEDGTQWHFNPPYSPNFGGLWEAGVKSIKFHLRRILTTNLTFEEMTTTLCEIEACLNSRPLCPIDISDIDNLDILTPGHFLIGEAPIKIPEPDIRDVNLSRLSRWQHTQRLVQNFWYRWQTEYLTRLQERPKWQKRGKEFQIGDVVVLKDENLPPGKWALGLVVERHPGQDGMCRVYSVRCHGKIVKRSVSKLCELPIDYD